MAVGRQAVQIRDVSDRILSTFSIAGLANRMLASSEVIVVGYGDEGGFTFDRAVDPLARRLDKVVAFDHGGRFVVGYPSLGSIGSGSQRSTGSYEPVECVALCWLSSSVVGFIVEMEPTLFSMSIPLKSERTYSMPSHMARYPDALTTVDDTIVTIDSGEVWAFRLGSDEGGYLLHSDQQLTGSGHEVRDGLLIQPSGRGYRIISVQPPAVARQGASG
jgi:hypothetical protein